MNNLTAMKCGFALISIMFISPVLAQIAGFSDLQNDSQQFVGQTCGGFVRNGAEGDLEVDLFNACTSMVQSTNQIIGTGPTTNSRNLDAENLAGAYQNIVNEETFAPMSIATDASFDSFFTISSHIQKIRKSAGVLAYNDWQNSSPRSYASLPSGGSAGDGVLADSRFGFFVNGIGGFGETDRTDRENGSDFNIKGVVAGLDYRVMEQMVVGIAGGYSYLDIDFDKDANIAGGSVNADNYNMSAYLTYYVDDFYVDGIFTYGLSDYKLQRSIKIGSNTAVAAIDRLAEASPEGDQYTGNLALGYNFHQDSLNFGPYAQVNYLYGTIDSYQESGAAGLNLAVAEQNVESLESVFGAQMSYAWSRSFGVLVPHIRFEWHHEFKDNARRISATYVNDPRQNQFVALSDRPDRNFFNLGAGLSANFKHGFQGFFDYATVLGLNAIESHVLTAGIRVMF